MMRASRVVCPVVSALLLAVLTGCASGPVVKPSSSSVLGLHGNVHGGQQPVTGATIQLYAVGTTGDGSAATPLLTQTVKSNQYGDFDLTGLYTCPTPTTEVYVTGTGGNPGLAAGTNNPALVEFAALGQCGELSPKTKVMVNEVTTISSIGAFAPFAKSYSAIGSGSTDVTAFEAAFDEVNEFVNVQEGVTPGPTLPSNDYGSQLEINTLGNILAPCINSAGGVAGDGSACGKLFSLTTPPGGVAPTDTFAAALEIVLNPTVNIPGLYGLIDANAPFQPDYSSVPAALAVAIVPFAAPPEVSPCYSTSKTPPTVSITDATPGASISYQIGTAGYVPYNAPFTLQLTELYNPFAVQVSAPGFATYGLPYHAPYSCSIQEFTPDAPVFSQQTACFPATQSVTLSSTTPGASIYYTTDGSTPTTKSTLYSGPIQVTTTETISAISNLPPYNSSSANSQTYYGTNASVVPSFSPGGGTYVSAQVSIYHTGDPTGCAAIYYTNDGSTPTTASTLYTGPIAISTPTILQAIAVKPGFSSGSEVTAAYSINLTPLSTTVTPVQSNLSNPNGVAVDSVGNIYVANSGTQPNPAPAPPPLDGFVTRNGSPIATQLNYPTAIAVNPQTGDVFIADPGDSEVVEVSTNGRQTMYGGPTTAIPGILTAPVGVVADASGNVYVADYGANTVFLMNGGNFSLILGGGGVNTSAPSLNSPTGLALGGGNLYVAQSGPLLSFNLASGVASYPAGGWGASDIGVTYGTTGLYATDGSVVNYVNYGNVTALTQRGQLVSPTGIAEAPDGTVYVADPGNGSVDQLTFHILPTNYAALPPPVLSLAGGTYTGAQIVYCHSTVLGAVTQVTTSLGSGSLGACSDTVPVSIQGSQTIRAVSSLAGADNSPAATATYVIH